ncbi:hypothetical protein D9M69_379220 [compost metagenome]
MQQETLIQLLAAALFISLIGGAAIALWSAGQARAAGFDEGHLIASTATAERIALLHDDIARLNRRREEDRALHQQYCEQLIQDADRRIAIYARRALTEHDADWLAATVKTLHLASDTFAGVYAWDKHKKALREAQELTRIHAQLTKALAGEQESNEPDQEAAA